jgi:antitoxin HigA-1
VSRPTLFSLLNGNAGLPGDIALHIEKAFGVRMDTLMKVQAAYDRARTAAAKTPRALRSS